MHKLAGLAVVIGASGVAVAATGGILVSSVVQPGLWQLRSLNGGGPPLSLCLRTAEDVVQLRHPGRTCSRFVVTNAAESATIHYSCGAAGYGETAITAETGQLINVRSQGLVGQSPFEVAYEGRRVGACAVPRRRR